MRGRRAPAVLIAFLFSALSGTAYPPEFPSVMKYAAGMACVIGHIFPVFYGFRGARGWSPPPP